VRTDPTPSNPPHDLPPEPEHAPGSEVSIGTQQWGMLLPTLAALAFSIAMGGRGDWW
jgi:hypothetical protein